MVASARTRLLSGIVGSRFGRRLLLMFCLAALAPAAIVFWMTYRTATGDAREARLDALRTGSKDFGLGVLGRLQLADRALAASDPVAVAEGSAGRQLALYFVDVEIAPAVGRAAQGASSRLSHGLVAGERVVRLEQTIDGQRLGGTLNPRFVWGDPDEMGQDMRICVFASGARLFCGGHPGTEAGERLLSQQWELFLRPGFGANSWRVVSVSGTGPGLRHYSGILAPAALAVLLFAVLLSSIQVRRILVPLSDLMRRIDALQGRADAPVAAADGDEFATLSRSFGDMQRRIGLQMETLRTASEAERMILAGESLPATVTLVLREMRRMLGPAVVCIGLLEEGPEGDTVTFLADRADGDASGPVERIECTTDGGVTASTEDGDWFAVDVLQDDALQAAFIDAGAREVHVLAPGSAHGGPRALLGVAAPGSPDGERRAAAARLLETIPIAAAFEERADRLQFQARHDALTGLPNRLATFEAVSAAIAASGQAPARFALIFLDLDRFKSVNDGLGHAFGDELLASVADRLREAVDGGDFVGRFGGDEFCLMLPRGSAHALERSIARIREAFARPVDAGGRAVLQRFSAGVALHPEHGADASTLIRNADVAMYHGKRAGGNTVQMFAPEMEQRAGARVQMENALRSALAAGALHVHYQPRIDSRDGRIVGVEALARWTHLEWGVVPPATFVPLAEDCGLIEELGASVLRTACAQLAGWKRLGLTPPLLAINVSGMQLRSGQLPETLDAEMRSAGIAAHELEIEITETMLVQDGEADRQLQRIRDLGVRIAIDDFGTGYSSLSYLAVLPCDTVKIDRSFVLGLQRGDAAMMAVIRSIIALARDLGKHVVAEGVESMTEVETLAAWGCPVIQGFVYHPPLAPDAIAALLGAERAV